MKAQVTPPASTGTTPPGLESAAQYVIALATRGMASALDPHFSRYETLVRVPSPAPRFQYRIAVAVARYMLLASNEATATLRRTEAAGEKRALALKVRAARRAMRAFDRAVAHAGKNSAASFSTRFVVFKDWAALAWHYDKTFGEKRPRLRRRRPKHAADETFVRELAATYEEATGLRPTISTNYAKTPPYGGPFIDLIEAVQSDAKAIFRRLDPDLNRPLSTSIARFAKGLRLTA
jgi:hypothetical protein